MKPSPRHILILLAWVATFFVGVAVGENRAAAETSTAQPSRVSVGVNATQIMPVDIGLETDVAAQIIDAMNWAALAVRENEIAGSGSGLESGSRPVVSQPGPAPSSSGGCEGVIPSSIIYRESRCDPYAVNSSSGAFGLYQIMPAWWSGRCSHLNRYSVSDQHACASIILATQGPSAWSQTW